MKNDIVFEYYDVSITVIKKHFNPEFLEQYAPNPEAWGECTHFNIGDEFVVKGKSPWTMPEGFCGWAWADIQQLVFGMARGGMDSFVTCCTDGFRPVLFGLKKIK